MHQLKLYNLSSILSNFVLFIKRLEVFCYESAVLVFRPTWEDMIIAYSSLPGYASVRDHEKGTWFIQSLVEGKPQGADSLPPRSRQGR